MAKELKIEDLDPKKPIYVRLTPMPGRVVGDLNLTLHTASGQPILVYLAKTFIPIRVTQFAPAEMFINSPDFRMCLARGFLKLVDPDEAEKELQTEEARKELERLRKEVYSNISIKDTEERTPIEVIDDIGNDNVKASIKDLMIRTDIDDEAKINNLRIERPTLTKDDWNFMISVADEKSELYKWLKANCPKDLS